MSVKERLKKFAKTKEKSVRAFETNCGLTNGYINDIVGGRLNKPSTQTLNKILTAYTGRINSAWLLTGEGPMLKDDIEKQSQSAECQECRNKEIEMKMLERFNSQLAQEVSRLTSELAIIKDRYKDQEALRDKGENRSTA